MPWQQPKSDDFQMGADVTLRNARVPSGAVAPGLPMAGDGLVLADIALVAGKVAKISAPAEGPGRDLAGSLIWPCPVDCHSHIDKGQVWGRSANSDGTFAEALRISGAETLAAYGADDQRSRSAFMLKSAYAHGTSALRSHVDSGRETFDQRWHILTELAQDWQGRVAVTLAPFTGPEEPEAWVETLAKRATASVSGVLSGFLYDCAALPGFLDRMIRLADTHGLALDFHADETLEATSHCLRAVAEAVLRHRFQGPVLVGHCCALSVQTKATRRRTLDLVAKAGISIVSLPLCNAYLMDRGPGTPRLRGFPPVHEMRDAGIKVALGSDNVRDAFFAYGDLDMVELFRDAARMMQLDHPVGDWPDAVLARAADAIGRPDLGRITPGAPADLILFSARNWSEFLARPQSDRIVLRAGRAIDTTPPDYRELDPLKGLTAWTG